MYKIRKLNPVSDIVSKYLSPDSYTLSDDENSPDGILVRSASMHDYSANKELQCVARAGAGYNNIPYDDFAQKWSKRVGSLRHAFICPGYLRGNAMGSKP